MIKSNFLKVALAQIAPVWLHKEHTIQKIETAIVDAAKEKAELIDANKKNTKKTHEAADVLYHLMVLLEANDIKIEDVMDELKKRQKK